MAKIERDSGPNGGDRLIAQRGGIIKVCGLGTGGAQIQASGGQAANIVAVAITTVTSGVVVATALDADLDEITLKLNSVITALKNIGVLATS